MINRTHIQQKDNQMDTELALCMNVKDNRWFLGACIELADKTVPWEERVKLFVSKLLNRGGLTAFESSKNARTIIAYPSNTRRIYPAFITVNLKYDIQYPEAVFLRGTGACMIEVVEAGNYAMAGGSEEPKNRRKAEGTALWN